MTDDFEALVDEELRQLVSERSQKRVEADREKQEGDERAAAVAAKRAELASSAIELEALAKRVAQKLHRYDAVYYYRIVPPSLGESHSTAGLIPRARGWRGSIYSRGQGYYLALSVRGRLFWAQGLGSRSGFSQWADLSALELDVQQEVRRGLARLLAAHDPRVR